MADNVIRFEFAGGGNTGSGKGATTGTGGGAGSSGGGRSSGSGAHEQSKPGERYAQMVEKTRRTIGAVSEAASQGSESASGAAGVVSGGAFRVGGALASMGTVGMLGAGAAGIVGAGALAVGLSAAYASHKAESLASFSPEIAIARAEAKISDIMQNMREAQVLGPSLAQFTKVQSELLEDIHELLLPIKQFVVEVATGVLTYLRDAIRAIMHFLNEKFGMHLGEHEPPSSNLQRLLDSANAMAAPGGGGGGGQMPAHGPPRAAKSRGPIGGHGGNGFIGPPALPKAGNVAFL